MSKMHATALYWLCMFCIAMSVMMIMVIVVFLATERHDYQGQSFGSVVYVVDTQTVRQARQDSRSTKAGPVSTASRRPRKRAPGLPHADSNVAALFFVRDLAKNSYMLLATTPKVSDKSQASHPTRWHGAGGRFALPAP